MYSFSQQSPVSHPASIPVTSIHAHPLSCSGADFWTSSYFFLSLYFLHPSSHHILTLLSKYTANSIIISFTADLQQATIICLAIIKLLSDLHASPSQPQPPSPTQSTLNIKDKVTFKNKSQFLCS